MREMRDASTQRLEQESIDEVRAYFGLRKHNPGQIRCKRCGRLFKSWDKTSNQYCVNCQETWRRMETAAMA